MAAFHGLVDWFMQASKWLAELLRGNFVCYGNNRLGTG